MCNPLKLNISTEMNYNEGRNSVANSEDSGISSSNGEDVSITPTIKYNSHSPCSPLKQSRTLYNISPSSTIELKSPIPNVNPLNSEINFDTHAIRPNSASSSLSHVSDNERSEVNSRLALPDNKMLELEQRVS